jgi:Domain of unknown function (DUF4251)
MKLNQHPGFLAIFLLTLMLGLGSTAFAQNQVDEKAEKEEVVKKMIDDHRFIFKAQSVHPSRGRVVQLNSDYDLKVSPDTVRSYLPYFGRAYSAPIGGPGGGIDFLSRQFDYTQKARKKGGWDILIRPKDISDVREMSLTIFQNGTGSLRVSSNNREPISYNGYLVIK